MNGSSMTAFAWVFMLSSMTAVSVLVVYCYKRILFDSDGGNSDAGATSEDEPTAGG